MADLKHYVIRGGIEGRERLKILSRVMAPYTCAVFERVGITSGMKCLDIGCGSGHVTMELAKRVAPDGLAVGADIDSTKIELARRDAEDANLNNIEFRIVDSREQPSAPEFDLVYARFLLTHLSDPAGAVAGFYQHLKPGGLAIVEDIDCTGLFVYPDSPAFNRFLELYCTVVRKRGGDPNIGPRLPLLLKQGGFTDVEMSVAQPIAMEGEAKLLNPLTLENIADALITENLATQEEIAELVEALYSYAADPLTLAGVPRVVQAWGRRPAS